MHQRSQLPINTRQRFVEIRISFIYKKLILFYGNDRLKATRHILTALEPTPNEIDEMEAAIVHPRFRNPQREELYAYLKYEPKMTYNMIRRIAGGSPNRIAQYRFIVPQLFPVSTVWKPHHENLLQLRIERYLDIYDEIDRY